MAFGWFLVILHDLTGCHFFKMKTALFILTPSSEFGELINQALRETDRYDVYNLNDMQLATTLLEDHPECKHVMLDTALGNIEVIELSHIMRRNNPDINIILVARDELPPEFEEIRPWKLLRKPFLVRDLLAVLESSWPSVIELEAVSRAEQGSFTRLNDSSVAGQILEQSTVEPEVQQALILRNHAIWASAGRFESKTIEEIGHVIGSNMELNRNDDLLRYVLVKATQQQHGVYAKFLASNTILALIFDPQTPVSRMRRHANTLADALSDPAIAGSENWSPSLLPAGIDLPVSIQSGEQVEASFASGDWHSRPFDDFQVGRSRLDDPIAHTIQPAEHLWDDNFVACSCLLTPRFEAHQLSGDLADLLYEKLPQICISFGWRLGFFEVDMNCIHWVVKLPPDISPVEHIETVRKTTSDYIFQEYPGHLNENFSGDFWAPGFSVISGMQHHTSEQILAFVQKNRISSGVYRL